MCLHCIAKVSNCSIKSCGRSWLAHEGTLYAYTKALLGKNCLSSHSCHVVKNHFFWTKLLHAYVQCVYIVKAKYQIAPSKAVVGVYRPMKAPSMHIQKPYKEKLSKFSLLPFCQKLFFLNQTPSCICSMCLHCICKVSNCSIKSCGRSWSAHGGTIYAYTYTLLGKNCLSSHCCHFVKNIFFWTKLLHAYVQCVYIVSAKYQIVPSKAVVGVDRPMKAPSMHIYKHLIRRICLSSHCCHFVKKKNFWTKLLCAYVQYVYIV